MWKSPSFSLLGSSDAVGKFFFSSTSTIFYRASIYGLLETQEDVNSIKLEGFSVV